jgi:hypothetical protein
MSETSGKKKAKKPAQDGVLGTLPATRPARVGRARPGSARSHAATARPAPARAKPTAAKPAAARPAAAKPTATKAPAAKTARSKAAPKPPPEPARRREAPPSGADLAVTAARAVGELAQIGASVGAKALKRAASRLPRP